MMMTNYMDLLAANSPWNLILFMVIPVAAAEAMVAAEFYMLYRKDDSTQTWQKISKALGIFSGIYFAAVVVYLIAAVIPSLHWRGIIDEIAIFFYLLGIFPLGAITLLELGAIGRSLSERERMRKHFQFLIGFLIVSHIAMIFGMANPTLSGWRPSPAEHEAHGHGPHGQSILRPLAVKRRIRRRLVLPAIRRQPEPLPRLGQLRTAGHAEESLPSQ